MSERRNIQEGSGQGFRDPSRKIYLFDINPTSFMLFVAAVQIWSTGYQSSPSLEIQELFELALVAQRFEAEPVVQPYLLEQLQPYVTEWRGGLVDNGLALAQLLYIAWAMNNSQVFHNVVMVGVVRGRATLEDTCTDPRIPNWITGMISQAISSSKVSLIHLAECIPMFRIRIIDIMLNWLPPILNAYFYSAFSEEDEPDICESDKVCSRLLKDLEKYGFTREAVSQIPYILKDIGLYPGPSSPYADHSFEMIRDLLPEVRKHIPINIPDEERVKNLLRYISTMEFEELSRYGKVEYGVKDFTDEEEMPEDSDEDTIEF
jgi:hypothetical protein